MPRDGVTLNLNHPIVYEDGTPTPYLQTQLIKLAAAVAIIGTGNPEGVVNAPVYTLYIDETTPLSPVQYMKMLPSVTGDNRKGWAAL